VSDVAERLLAAIAEAEATFRSNANDEEHQVWALTKSPDYNEGLITQWALDGLRHCAAHREIVAHFGALVARYQRLKRPTGMRFTAAEVTERQTVAARIADFSAIILPALAHGYGIQP
jgi:hypothetical protein